MEQPLIISATLCQLKLREHSPSTRQCSTMEQPRPDMESQTPGQQQTPAAGALGRRTLLFLSIANLILGGAAGPLFARIYFLHGGARLWLISLLQTCAFPILFLPLSVSYFRRRRRRGGAEVFSLTGRAAAVGVVFGVLSSLGTYMSSYGAKWLPLSISSILGSTQLAFTAVFAFLVVRQKFTAYSVNAVVLLVMGPVIVGVQSSSDRPAGVSNRQYYLGFFLMLGTAALSGLLTPLVELTFASMKRKVAHVQVMEMQVVLATSASILCAVAMVINKDFQAIPREAKAYALGETKYYLVLAACAFFAQLTSLGLVGIIFCWSSLLAGIVTAALLPVGLILPVLVLHEKFNGGKGVATALCIWGFASYLYGEHKQHKKLRQTVAT